MWHPWFPSLATERFSMSQPQICHSSRIACHVVKQGAHPANPAVKKVATEQLRNTYLFKCKDVFITTFNMRTLSSESQTGELVALADIVYDIVCIQEHCLIHNNPIKYHQFGKWTFVTSSAWINRSDASTEELEFS